MFGVLDLATGFEGCRFAIGVRNANNKRFRLACTVGLRVFVCHNLAFIVAPCISIDVDRPCRTLIGTGVQRDYLRLGDLSSKSTLLAVGFSVAMVGRGMVGALRFLRDYDVVGFSKTRTKIPPVLAMGGSGRFHTGGCSLCPAIKNSRQKFWL
jgi:hypothetical protein